MSTTGSKKTTPIAKRNYQYLELDELYWFIGEKGTAETRENVYLMTIVSRETREIVGFDVAFDKSPARIRAMADRAPTAEKYCTDGYFGYVDIVYPGKHIRNVKNKKDTFTVESVNADLRHYIPVLARRSRCFSRKLETLYAVVAVFVEAYNAFNTEKTRWKERHPTGEFPFGVVNYF